MNKLFEYIRDNAAPINATLTITAGFSVIVLLFAGGNYLNSLGTPLSDSIYIGSAEASIVKYYYNSTPVIYFHNAVDYDKRTITCNTTYYDVFLESRYLGKFPGMRNNASNIELWYNDVLDLFITTEGPYPTVLKYHVSTQPVQHIVPTVWQPKKHEQFKFKFIDDYHMEVIRDGDRIKTILGQYFIDLRVSNQGYFDSFACKYPDEYMIVYIQGSLKKYINSPDYTYTAFNIDEFNDMVIRLREDLTFNATVTCMFLDKTYYISRDGRILEGYYDDVLTDIGLPNPEFSFIIEKVENLEQNEIIRKFP